MVGLLFAVSADDLSADQTTVSIRALDPHGKVQEGVRFTFADIESLPTDKTGVTDLAVPPLESGRSIEMDLPSGLGEEWVLIDGTVHVPVGRAEGPAEVVVMLRADLRLFAGKACEQRSSSAVVVRKTAKYDVARS